MSARRLQVRLSIVAGGLAVAAGLAAVLRDPWWIIPAVALAVAAGGYAVAAARSGDTPN